MDTQVNFFQKELQDSLNDGKIRLLYVKGVNFQKEVDKFRNRLYRAAHNLNMDIGTYSDKQDGFMMFGPKHLMDSRGKDTAVIHE